MTTSQNENSVKSATNSSILTRISTDIKDKTHSLIIATYRPTKCPISSCGGVLSPSSMLPHFEYMHREITTAVLNILQGSVTLNVSLEYNKLQPVHPTVVKAILLHGFNYESVPILLNMNLLPELKCSTDGNRHNEKHRSNWLIIWLSSLHTFPFLFSVTIQTYGLPRLCFTKQCSPISLHEDKEKTFIEMSPLEDSRTMLLNTESIEKLIKNENGLYVDIKIIPTE